MRTKRAVSAAAAVVLLCALSCLPAACGTTRMTWARSSNSSALCNDFTRAGYFLRRNLTSDDWVIFLESGSLCFSNETCNRRFFLSNIRERFNDNSPGAPPFGPFGNFDPAEAWSGTFGAGDEPKDIISPLMSSMECFMNRSDYFPGGEFSLLGTDILDQDPVVNPLFSSYNHVVIPYCSSDVWLGNEMDDTRSNTAADGECDCFDYDCFNYVPDSGDLQFTFRGKIIFESIITDLMGEGLGQGQDSQLVLAGSSAGGLGVLNHAKYVRDLLPNTTQMRVIFDSAWFINFQGNIFREFDGVATQSESETQRQNTDALLNIIGSNEACADTDLGFPCCTAAYCIFTETNSAGERYYPSDVPTFGIFGLYDIFLLAPSLAGVATVENQRNAVGFAIDFLRTVGEYGGDMNGTIAFTQPQASFFSYYVTQCFQHIHFATSSLWGATGASVFGSSSVELERELASFTHTVQSGVWSSRTLAGVTVRDALMEWNGNAPGATPVYFRDSCTGPYCNMECPEEFNLGQLTSNNWPLGVKIIVTLLIVGLTVLCMIMKFIFGLWLCRLNWKQNNYLDTLETDDDEAEDKLQFPDCADEDAISVACLDLHYSVTFRAKKVKDEKKDQLAPLVLHNITPDGVDEDDIDDEDPFTHIGASGRRRSSAPRRFTDQKHPPASELLRGLVKRSTRRGDKSPKDPEAAAHILSLSQSASPQMDEEPLTEELAKKAFGRRQKEILKGMSIYFNPGEMVGIMGPSGCGKTTFLDLLTGRRKSGTFSGEIYINGMKMEDVRDWYIANTGYVLQLATPYYEELTVRENLTLSAAMKLPDKFTLREKFERVEQVMEVSGLSELADTIVGGVTGPGLSGGQKRRLAVALQLLKLPNVIFLDEPTSGLDAASSFELLGHLNRLADSNRTIILTIHQPRLEIFHMFHRLVLLVDGKIAYHGVPEKAYEVFVNALKIRYLELGLIIPELEDHNPADVIMDMLGNPRMRRLITEYYQTSCEPALVTRAIKAARWKEQSLSVNSLDTQSLHSVGYLIWGAKRPSKRHAGQFTRLAVLEARASKRAKILQVLYLPIIFFVYGVMLGTVYLQTASPLLVVSGYTVYSVASALFMFPVLYDYYFRALEVYTYERGDGVGRSHDLVIQGFIRGVATAALPVALCAGVLYVLLVDHNSYNLLAFLQVVLVNMALNQTWTALLIALICSYPSVAFRISPIIASLAGFTSGFFIPIEQIPWWYRWMVYINPNYYGFSTSSFFLLSDFQSNCVGTQFECFTSSGEYILQQFNFDNINPYLHIVILLSFTVFYLFVADFANWIRYTTIKYKIKRVCRTVLRLSTEDAIMKEPDDRASEADSLGDTSLSDVPFPTVTKSPLYLISEEPEETPAMTPHTRAVMNWKIAASRSIDDVQEEETAFAGPGGEVTTVGEEVRPGVRKVRIKDAPERPSHLTLEENGNQAANGVQPEKVPPKSLFLREGARHTVWKPKVKKTTPQLANVVTEMLKTKEAPQNLRQRQKTLAFRVLATQAVLKEQNEELISGDLQPDQQRKHISLKEASRRILSKQKSQTPVTSRQLTDIVTRFVESERAEKKYFKRKSENELSPMKAAGDGAGNSPRSILRHTARGTQKRGSYAAVGAVPLQKWKNVVRQHKKLQSVDESTDADIQETRSPVVKQSAIDVEASLWVKPEKAAHDSPQQKRKISLARQEWTESVDSDSAEPKTKEERLQDEETRPSSIRTPSPPSPTSGVAADLKPDKEGLSVDDPHTSSNFVAPTAMDFRTVQIDVEPVPSSGQPVALERYRSEQQSRTPDSAQPSSRRTTISTDRPDSVSPVEFLPRRFGSADIKNISVSPPSDGTSRQQQNTSQSPDPNVSRTWV